MTGKHLVYAVVRVSWAGAPSPTLADVVRVFFEPGEAQAEADRRNAGNEAGSRCYYAVHEHDASPVSNIY